MRVSSNSLAPGIWEAVSRAWSRPFGSVVDDGGLGDVPGLGGVADAADGELALAQAGGDLGRRRRWRPVAFMTLTVNEPRAGAGTTTGLQAGLGGGGRHPARRVGRGDARRAEQHPGDGDEEHDLAHPVLAPQLRRCEVLVLHPAAPWLAAPCSSHNRHTSHTSHMSSDTLDDAIRHRAVTDRRGRARGCRPMTVLPPLAPRRCTVRSDRRPSALHAVLLADRRSPGAAARTPSSGTLRRPTPRARTAHRWRRLDRRADRRPGGRLPGPSPGSTSPATTTWPSSSGRVLHEDVAATGGTLVTVDDEGKFTTTVDRTAHRVPCCVELPQVDLLRGCAAVDLPRAHGTRLASSPWATAGAAG